MNSNKRIIAIVGAVVLVVVLVFVVALVATSGDDDGDEAAATSAAAEADDGADSDSGGGETRSVDVAGEPLTPFEEGTDPTVGTAAPVLQGEQYDGTPISIGEATDGPTMVVFLAHWCPHCNAEIPELIELQENGALPEDLNVIGVGTAVDPSADNYPPSEWFVETGWPWPAMADDEDLTAMVAYGGTSFPFTVLLDDDGTVLARKAGASSAEESQAWITSVLS